jgi:hypothetical protein
MRTVGQPLRLLSNRGRRTGGAPLRRHGAATVAAVAALIAAVGVAAGCATGPTSLSRPTPTAAQARANVTAGLDLYESGEFVLAARRFHLASTQASALHERRRLGELADCTARLEQLQRRERRSEPGVNTLIALGAIAGQRPLPALRIPNTVEPLFRQAAKESP